MRLHRSGDTKDEKLTSAPPAAGAGSGDVTASANLTDLTLVIGDGGAKGVQTSGVTHPSAGKLDELNTIQGTSSNALSILHSDGAGIAFKTLAVTSSTSHAFAVSSSTDAPYITGAGTTDAGIGLKALGTGNVDLTPITGNVDVTAGDLIISAGDLQFFTDSKGILDANGNRILNFSAVASANNYIEISNDLDPTDPTIKAVGAGLNPSIRLTPKGVGNVVVTNGNLAVSLGDVTIVTATGRLQFGASSGTSWLQHPASGGMELETVTETDFHFKGALDTITLNAAVLYGGTAGGADLTLEATTHATGGDIIFRESGVMQWAMDQNGDWTSAAGNQIGIGIGASTTPTEIIHAYHATSTKVKLETESGASQIRLYSYGATGQMQSYRAKGTATTPLVNVTNDFIGGFTFHPWYGGTFPGSRAAIFGKCDGVQSASNNLPTRLTLHAGTSAATERGRVDSAGSFEMDSWVGFNGQSAAAPPTYTTATYTPDRAISNSSTIATAELGDVLSTLIDDLIAIGLLQ